MKIKYDQEVDILKITFSEASVYESDESKVGVILDFGKDGTILAIEIMDASKRTASPSKLEYEVIAA